MGLPVFAMLQQSAALPICSISTVHACCRWVDEVVKDAPWVLDIDFINKHKIDYVTHDALPYSDASGQSNDVYDFVSIKFAFICCFREAKHVGSAAEACSQKQKPGQPGAGQETWQVQGNTANGRSFYI